MKKTPEQATAELATHLRTAAGSFEPADGQHVLHAGSGLIGRFRASRWGGTLEASEGLSVDAKAGDLLPVTDALQGVTRFWKAEIVFENEGETFGSHDLLMAARNKQEARLVARHAATSSMYDDDRVSDRSCSVEVEEWPDMVADVDVLEEFRENATPRP